MDIIAVLGAAAGEFGQQWLIQYQGRFAGGVAGKLGWPISWLLLLSR